MDNNVNKMDEIEKKLAELAFWANKPVVVDEGQHPDDIIEEGDNNDDNEQ